MVGMEGMNISKLGEFGLIDSIKRSVIRSRSVVKGIGDDTAVLPLDAKRYLLFTTDMIVEGVHFTRKMGAQAIGHKALACNISDIAAMGGVPTYAVISIGLPPGLPVRFVQDIYKGINALAKQFNVAIVGGDTVRSEKIVINIALLGEVEKQYLTLRSGAKKGDWIFVTGALGGSLKSKKHLTFNPRLAEARFLVERFKPNAMIDISDGLAGDLGHILKESKVGALLYQDQIPLARGVSIQQALTDGEDFELLFTFPLKTARRLIDWQIQNKCWYFYHIGVITPLKGMKMEEGRGNKRGIKIKGYEHF